MNAVLGGTSLTSIAILWGLPPILFGRAALEGFPSWLGWSGLAVGVATAQFLHPDLMPGFLIYGPLVLAVQLWSLALTVWRRAGDTHHPGKYRKTSAPIRRGLFSGIQNNPTVSRFRCSHRLTNEYAQNSSATSMEVQLFQ